MSNLESKARQRTGADLVYESIYCAAIGGSAIALFFLVFDAWNGRLLFTPSLMWGVLFGGANAQALDAANTVRVEWAAYATIAHTSAFAVIGTAVVLLAHEIELHVKRPFVAFVILFALVQESFVIAASTMMPGVMEVLGWGKVLFANLLATAGITVFLWHSHSPERWEEFKQAAHLA